MLGAWEATLERRHDEPAIFDPQRRVLFRFGEIEERSRRCDDLQDFAAGEIVAIQIGNHADWPALFLACLRRQVVVLPLEPTMSEQERDLALRTCRAAGLIAAPERPVVRLDAGGAIDWEDRRPVLLKLTSGTTATPRAVRFRSAQLLADAEQICDTMGIFDADLNFAVIPLSHSYGFSNLITPLLVRGVPMVISNDRMPRAVLDDLARTESTVFPGIPLYFQAFGELMLVPQLPKLRLCISAGAPLTLAVARSFEEKFGLPDSLVLWRLGMRRHFLRSRRSRRVGRLRRVRAVWREVAAARTKRQRHPGPCGERCGGRWVFSGARAGEVRRRFLSARRSRDDERVGNANRGTALGPD